MHRAGAFGTGGTPAITAAMDAGTVTMTGPVITAGRIDGLITGNGGTHTATAIRATMMMDRPMHVNPARISAIPATLMPATAKVVKGTIEDLHLAVPVSLSTMTMGHPIANPATILAIPAPQARAAVLVMPAVIGCSSLGTHTVAAQRDTTMQALSTALPVMLPASLARELPLITA